MHARWVCCCLVEPRYIATSESDNYIGVASLDALARYVARLRTCADSLLQLTLVANFYDDTCKMVRSSIKRVNAIYR
eukprot:8545529-Pyramimonas_sp.AAC.1